ncbi:MAG: PKD domain-containing protein [Dehalococcoidales bacterium]|nr:PKD domain-containing protein [Dehalococcoidales bacterium]
MAKRLRIHCRNISWTVVILFFSMISLMVGCGNKGGDSITDQILLLPVQLVASTETTHYEIPGQTVRMGVYCISAAERPDKPVYVWDISLDGVFIESIVQDSEKSTAPETEPEEELPEMFWPNGVHLNYELSKSGTYTFDVKLYEYEAYNINKTDAILYSSYTHTVYCEPIKMSIEVTPESTARHYDFKAVVANPKFVPAYYNSSWQFINQSTGLPDKGITTNISGEGAIGESGIHEVTHVFPGTGSYLVVFMLEDDFDYFARGEIMVEISSDFTITVPSEPLRTSEEYTFYAWTDTPETLPDDVYYVWDFGDGPELTIPFNNECTHIFTDAGPYAIHVGVFKPGDAADMPIGSAIATVKVTEEKEPTNFLDSLQQTNWIEIGLVCPVTTAYGTNPALISEWGGYISEWGVDDLLGEIQWEGSHFSVTWSSNRHSEIISGNVRQDGNDLYVSLKARHEEERSTENLFWEIEISELPLSTDRLVKYGENRFEARMLDSDVPQYVTYFGNRDLVSVDWTSKLQLNVVFDKKTP